MSARETLIAARGVVATDGWCTDMLLDYDGRHCAVGAVCEVLAPVLGFPGELHALKYWHEMRSESAELNDALSALARQAPVDGYSNWSTVTEYNNTFDDVEGILAMFDAAIAETV